LYTATVDPRFVGSRWPGPDLALVEILDPAFAWDLPPIGLAAIDGHSPTAKPVGRCHAIGYLWFAGTPSPTAVRDTVDAIGVLPGGLGAGQRAAEPSRVDRTATAATRGQAAHRLGAAGRLSAW
jgi:hypothetical protein